MSIISEVPANPSTAQAETRAPRWHDARDQMIHACALQEHIIASGPCLPREITIHERVGLAGEFQFPTPETDLDVHLHPGDSIAAFQAFLGGDLRESVQPAGDGAPPRVVRQLRGEAFGCSFLVWAVTDAQAVTQ